MGHLGHPTRQTRHEVAAVKPSRTRQTRHVKGTARKAMM